MKRILILSFSVIRNDPRVMRQIRLLEKDYQLAVSGFGSKPDANIRFLALENPRLRPLQKLVWAAKLSLRLSESYYWSLPQVRQALELLTGLKFELLIANDIITLPVGLRLAGSKPVLVDAHEYSPLEFEDKWVWRLLFAPHYDSLCARYLSRAACMTTVCKGIADEYGKHYGVTPQVIYNATIEQSLRPSRVIPGQVRLIHHGAAIRSRHLGMTIELMRHLDERFTLDLMLVETDPVHMMELRAMARGDHRIRFVEPVALEEICQRINEYDVGLFLLPPVNFNYRHALPNKFFEFVQARLVIAIGPSPEMAALVDQYSLGLVADSFQPEALAAMLRQLTDESLMTYKLAVDRAAAELNFGVVGKALRHEIQRLVP